LRRAARGLAVLLAAASASAAADPAPDPAAPRRDRVAIIDLGADGAGAGADARVRAQLAALVEAAGLAPVIGDGVEHALAGVAAERDAVELAAAIGSAQRAFGALDCPGAIAAGSRAAGIAAARQAAGLAVPELARAWAYVLLCADRAGDGATAEVAAARLRAAGGSADVPEEVWRRYPEVDAVVDREVLELEIRAELPGAEVWIDHRRAGVAPLRALLPAGAHVIAAGAGSRRGWVAGTVVRAQREITIPMPEQAGPWDDVARRVAGWGVAVPGPTELGWALTRVRAIAAVVRRGDRIEAWGRPGLALAPGRLGGEDGIGAIADAARVIGVIADRARAWRDRAPDPDRPLLVEDLSERVAAARDRRDPPTRWWVYATIAGALGASAAIVLLNETTGDRQRVELRYP
jgi:hypothetical protein